MNKKTIFLVLIFAAAASSSFMAGRLTKQVKSEDLAVNITPKEEVPQMDIALSQNETAISGQTSPGITIRANGEIIEVGEGGQFQTAGPLKTLEAYTDQIRLVWQGLVLAPTLTQAEKAGQVTAPPTGQFVASKSGKKYHPVENCSYADRIKEENKIYFNTREEAEKAGLEPSSCFK